jgi:hypothetical protein
MHSDQSYLAKQIDRWRAALDTDRISNLMTGHRPSRADFNRLRFRMRRRTDSQIPKISRRDKAASACLGTDHTTEITQ